MWMEGHTAEVAKLGYPFSPAGSRSLTHAGPAPLLSKALAAALQLPARPSPPSPGPHCLYPGTSFPLYDNNVLVEHLCLGW